MKQPPLPCVILASQSPRRHDLLSQTGLDFAVVIRPTDELLDVDMDAAELCLYNAREKAQAVSREFPAATVIGADTLVFLDNRPLGKPADLAEARNMLTLLSGRTHYVCTAVSVRSPLGNVDFTEMTEVQFLELDSDIISRYLSLVNVLDKAGSYAFQEHGDLIIQNVRGDTNNVIGLPVDKLVLEMQGLGYAFQA